jgi:glycerol-3-phosphate dehydrogenase
MTVLPGSLTGAPQYDLIVVGGGINGAAIVREAALHGHSALLLERDDLCSGTSAAATRLIHGGLRYLEYAEFGLVYESLREREYLLRTAGHLVEPLPIYIPAYAAARRARWQISLGLSLYDILSWRKSLPWHKTLSSEQMRAALPGIVRDGLRGGACYYDAQVTWPERLVVELCADAAQNGAVVRTHTPVTQIIADGGQVRGVEYLDGGETKRAAAGVVVNAAGPWVDRIAARYATQRLIGGTRGSHLVIRPVDGLPEAALYVEAVSDGRPFFIVPWNRLLLIGTTDVRFDGDPANVEVTEDERRWLIEETQRLFPQAKGIDNATPPRARAHGGRGIVLDHRRQADDSSGTRRGRAARDPRASAASGAAQRLSGQGAPGHARC